MIVYLFLSVMMTLIRFVFGIFPTTIAIPASVATATEYFFNITYGWNWLFPVDVMFKIFFLYLTIEIAVVIFNIWLAFMRWTRVIGN